MNVYLSKNQKTMTDSKLIPVWEWLKKKRKLILFVCGIIVLI